MKEILQIQPTQQEIVGLKPDSNAIQNVDMPTIVHRGTGDTIRWKSESDSPDENLILGINNIQALVFSKVPELISLPRDENGRIREENRALAESYIFEKVKTDKTLRSTLTTIGFHTNYPNEYQNFGRSTPYTLSVAFKKYGLFESEGQQFLERKRKAEQPVPSEITLIDTETNTQSTIKPIDNKTGREKLTKLIKGELTIDDIEPIYVTDFRINGEDAQFYVCYIGSKPVTISINLTAYKAYEERGGLLAIPRKNEKFGYQWFDFYEVNQDNRIDLNNKLDSIRFTNNGKFENQGWNGPERQAFIDYISGNLEVDNPNELPPFNAKIGNEHKGVYRVHIGNYQRRQYRIEFSKSIPISSEEIFIQPKYDEKRKYEWIEGYDTSDTEHSMPLFTRRIIDVDTKEKRESKEKRREKQIVRWKGPQIQSIVDWAYGRLLIEDIEEGEILVDEDKKHLIRFLGDPNLKINLGEENSSFDKTKPIYLVAKEEEPYKWIEVQQDYNLDDDSRRLISMLRLEVSESKPKLNGNWQGPDKQAIVDYIDGKIDPKYLRRLKLKVGNSKNVYIATFKGKQLTVSYLSLMRDNLLSMGDILQAMPTKDDEGELILGIAKENEEHILRRFKYDRNKNHFHVLDEQQEESIPPDQANEELMKFLEAKDE